MSREGIFIVAEIGVNWGGSPQVMNNLIDAAAFSGADAVKFQMFSPHEVRESVWRDALEGMVMHSADLYYYASRAKEKGLDVIVTPFNPQAVDELAGIGEVIDGIKVRAKDWTNTPLVTKAVATKKPVYISVPYEMDHVMKPEGMSDKEFTAAFLRTHTSQVSRVYCIPKYPQFIGDLSMRAAVSCDGYSNHFPEWTVPFQVACNRIFWEDQHNTKSRYYLEVHIMLDGANPVNTIDHSVSLSVTDLGRLAKAIDYAEMIS